MIMNPIEAATEIHHIGKAIAGQSASHLSDYPTHPWHKDLAGTKRCCVCGWEWWPFAADRSCTCRRKTGLSTSNEHQTGIINSRLERVSGQLGPIRDLRLKLLQRTLHCLATRWSSVVWSHCLAQQMRNATSPWIYWLVSHALSADWPCSFSLWKVLQCFTTGCLHFQ